MKKILSIIISIMILLSMTSVVSADNNDFVITNNGKQLLFSSELVYQDDTYTVYIDDVLVDVDVHKHEGSPVIPMKKMCELLGYVLVEEADGKVIITEGENCRHNGPMKIEFTIGDYYITHISRLDYVNKTETFPKEPITIKVGDEIYISPYYFSRVFGTKNVYTGEDNKIGIETWEYRNEKAKYGMLSHGTIFVKSFDNEEPRIELDGKTLEFTSKPFIDSEGRTHIPVREFCGQINYSVMWFENPDRVAISTVPPDFDKSDGGGAGGESYWFTIGDKQYRRGGTYYDMDTSAQIIDGRAYIPLRYFAQAARYNIAYNPGSHSQRFIGYGNRTLHSYLGKDKKFVLNELKLDDSYIISSTDTHSDYLVNHIIETHNQTSVNLTFDYNMLSGFAYIYKDYETAFVTIQRLRDYFNSIYGEAVTEQTEEYKISSLTEAEPIDEIYTYYDDWKAEYVDSNVEHCLFGIKEQKATHTLRLNKTPEGYFVFVQYYPVDRYGMKDEIILSNS